MRFFYTGIAFGHCINKNRTYTGDELVRLIVETVKKLYDKGWDFGPDECQHIDKIDLNNIKLDDIMFCQELCGADVILPSKL
tara:strand:- start:4665 stop:4910 length:246 start_codon:yes stop_codon:yes gene_type:complete